MITLSQSSVKVILVALIFNFQGTPKLKAQNLQFRQSFAQRTLLNPALIGTGQLNDEQSARISSGSKGQWLGLGKRLFAQSIAIDAPISNTNAAFSAGVYTTDLISGSEGRSKYSHLSAHLGYAY